MAKLESDFVEVAKIRKSFEVMRISNAIKHPDVRVDVTMGMLKAYGYVGTRAIEVLKETKSSALEKESKKNIFKRAAEAREAHKLGISMLDDNKNVMNEAIAKQLRHASILYKEASKIALKDNMVRQSSIAEKLSRRCMLPVHRHTYKEFMLKQKETHVNIEEIMSHLESDKTNLDSLIKLDGICRTHLIFWKRLHSFCFTIIWLQRVTTVFRI